MMNEEGGIFSVYDAQKRDAEKGEVLSESQGLYLLYAAEKGDRKAFEQAFSYVKNNMWQEGLASWQVKDGQASPVNALIDDFRLYRALKAAQKQWKG